LNLPFALIIMDGYGLEEPSAGNAISLAKTPCLDEVFESYPWVTLEASGEAVGLPSGQMGNSEVGHLNIGAGRVVYQELSRINRACQDGSLAENKVINAAFEDARKPGAVLHLMGLLSDGGVHSSNEHLNALLRHAKDRGVEQVLVHCFMDGRDVPPSSGIEYVRELLVLLDEINSESFHASIGSISGRYYAMDRDNRWDRVEKAYDALVYASPATNELPLEFMQSSYDKGVTDEFIVPAAFQKRGIIDGDSVLFFNFRPDRAREITRALVDESFSGFERKKRIALSFVCLTEYDPNINAPVAFEKEFPENVLADVISQAGLRQYHIAETEKYAHVTFFLNGGIEEAKVAEERVLIPSPKVATYDLQPEMSEPQVAKVLSEAIQNNASDIYIVNFANCDMVGHTGSIPAAVKAVEAVDQGVCEVLSALKKQQGIALLTADHGNADKMLDETGEPFTAHTTALVPLVLIDFTGEKRSLVQLDDASLGNIAPTILEIVGLQQPEEMTKKSILAK
jgi:2,3-bisphosphoglycerate-independent phosphoglycerate mutase